MSKQLILIRHAKSDWNHPDLSDFERPLNTRGQRDAAMMGLRLKNCGIFPDCMLSSPAKRAQSTAEHIANALEFPLSKIDWLDELYLADVTTMMQLIRQTPDKISTLALVAHNPGISMLATALAGVSIANMPTCANVRLQCDCDNWHATRKFSLLDFNYPKQEQRHQT